MLSVSSQKQFLFWRYLIFLPWLFGHVEKTTWLERWVNNKVYDIKTCIAKIKIHMLPNNLWSAGDQRKKFVQLIEYNKKNISFKNHTEMRQDFLLFFKTQSYNI